MLKDRERVSPFRVPAKYTSTCLCTGLSPSCSASTLVGLYLSRVPQLITLQQDCEGVELLGDDSRADPARVVVRSVGHAVKYTAEIDPECWRGGRKLWARVSTAQS